MSLDIMTRKNSHHVDEPDAECMLCGCLECGCHNPFEGCCDAILDCIKACCRPVTNCIKSVCEGFAHIWFTFAWILEYACTLAYNGLMAFICYYAFTCTGTTFTCPKGKCTASGKDPLEGAWTPELIAQLVTVGACVGLLFTSVYMLGIPAGYFDQPFDKSNLKIEHTLWVACQHLLKYMFLLPIQATGFNYNPTNLETSKYGDFMFMCYNDQVGKFLWGALDVETMGQFGPFVFMVLVAVLLIIFCMMSCSKKASFLCMECTCFSSQCYYALCWVAIACIWIGAPLAITSGVSAFFISFFSYSNAVLVLMALADFGYFLQWICAFAAPEGSYAHRMYVQQQKNLKTGKGGSGSEKTPMTGGSSKRPSAGRISNRVAGGRPSRISRNGPAQTKRGGRYQRASREEDPDYDVDFDEDVEVDCGTPNQTRDYNGDRYVRTGVEDGDAQYSDVEDPNGQSYEPCESGDAGGGFDMDDAMDTVNDIADKVNEYAPKVMNAINKYNKHNPEEEEEGDQADQNEEPEQDQGGADEAGADEAGGGDEAGGMFGSAD